MAMNRDRPEERWPFDPVQPDDKALAPLPEERQRVQKQTGHGEQPSPDYRSSEEKAK